MLEMGNKVYEEQKCFTKRLLKGSEETIKLYNEWYLIADRLYDKLPFRKIKIPNSQDDQEHAMNRIRDFLNMNVNVR